MRGGFSRFEWSDQGLKFSEGTGGEVANAQVCKTCIRGFNSRPVLQSF